MPPTLEEVNRISRKEVYMQLPSYKVVCTDAALGGDTQSVQSLPYLTVNVGQTTIIPRHQIAFNTAYLNKLMIYPINV